MSMKNFIKFWIVCVMALSAAGCVTSVPVKQIVENMSFPEIDTVATKSIGDILLSQGVRTTYPAIEMLQDAGGPGPFVSSGNIVKGIYLAMSQEGDNVIYKPRPSDAIMYDAVGPFFLAYSNSKLNMAWRGGFGNLVKGKIIDQAYYNETTATIESSSDFQQTLIYTGKEGNIIKATYREFSGNLARPAFTVDVTYDLKDSDTIAFRGARLQIIEATNTSIQYKVLSNFN
jgi:hypothetical protein